MRGREILQQRGKRGGGITTEFLYGYFNKAWIDGYRTSDIGIEDCVVRSTWRLEDTPLHHTLGINTATLLIPNHQKDLA